MTVSDDDDREHERGSAPATEGRARTWRPRRWGERREGSWPWAPLFWFQCRTALPERPVFSI